MTPLELIAAKRAHIARLANQGGACGEQDSIALMTNWIARPKSVELRLLLDELKQTGVVIKASSFDAISLSGFVDFRDPLSVRKNLDAMTFIEIKTANQDRVKPTFKGFFFALTESEIAAAEALGKRHRVALFNKKTGEILMTSVPEILSRTTSMTWQLSVQL